MISKLAEGALKSVMDKKRNDYQGPLLEVQEKDADFGKWRSYGWFKTEISRYSNLKELAAAEVDDLSQIENQVYKLWGEIVNVHETHGGDVSGDTPCAEQDAWKGCCDFCGRLMGTISGWLCTNGRINSNLHDVVILVLLFMAIGGRILLFMQVADMPNLYNMLDNSDASMGAHWHDFISQAAVEIRLRYILAFAIFAMGLRVITILKKVPYLGPVFTAIINSVVGDAAILVFLIVFFVMILTFFFAMYVFFSSAQGTSEFQGLGKSFFTTYRISLGDWDYESFVHASPVLGPLIFLFVTFILPLIMLNILIAVIGVVYEAQKEGSDKAWRNEAMRDYIVHSGRLGFVDVDDAAFPLPDCMSFAASKRMNFAKQIGLMRLSTTAMAWSGFRYAAVTVTSLKSQKEQKERSTVATGDLIQRLVEVAQENKLGKFA